MTTQPFDSAHSIAASNGHVLEQSVFQQPPNSSGFQVSTVLKRHEDRIKLGQFDYLSDCMEFIAKSCLIQNHHSFEMRRILGGISKTMNDDQLPWLLDGYAELFEANINLIQFDDDSEIDYNEILKFLNYSDNKVQSVYPNFIVIMRQTRKNLFAPLYITATNGSLQTSFPINDKGIIKDIYRFFQEGNFRKSENLSSEMCNLSSNNQGIENTQNPSSMNIVEIQIPSESTCEKNMMMTTMDVIENYLQLIPQLIKNSDISLDHIPISICKIITPTSAIDSTLNDFIQLSNDDTIKIVADMFDSILKLLRCAKNPSHMEEIETSSLIDTHSNQNSFVSNNTTNIQSSKRIRTDQSPSSETESFTNSKRLATSKNNQKDNILISNYDPPEILRQPARYQHVRMLSDLKKHPTQMIKGGSQDARQRTHVMVKVPKNDDIKELYLRVRSVTVNKNKHLFKTVIPQKPSTNKSSTSSSDDGNCLQLKKNYVDEKDGCTYLLIDSKERNAGKKEILAHLITLKQQGTKEEDLFKEENIHNVCKLEFCFCMRLNSGKYKPVSNVVYSTVIEDGDGPVKIDSHIDLAQKLCERGGQIINFGLSVECLKKGRIENESFNHIFVVINMPPKQTPAATAAAAKAANKCNPDHTEYQGHQPGYPGKGTKADLVNHAKQLNPNNSLFQPKGQK
ncbi:unnamed protein product [Rotaria sp. Silwood1]|nr:unnamed protein product [Rotaria sp. Silwood1]